MYRSSSVEFASCGGRPHGWLCLAKPALRAGQLGERYESPVPSLKLNGGETEARWGPIPSGEEQLERSPVRGALAPSSSVYQLYLDLGREESRSAASILMEASDDD